MPDLVLTKQDDDLLTCMQFITLEVQGKSRTQIAEEAGITRATLYNWINHWKESGVYDRARAAVMNPRITAIENATITVLERWPKILTEMANIAAGEGRYASMSGRTRIEAALFLAPFVQEELNKKDDPGTLETLYANADQVVFNPVDLNDAPRVTVNKKRRRSSRPG